MFHFHGGPQYFFYFFGSNQLYIILMFGLHYIHLSTYIIFHIPNSIYTQLYKYTFNLDWYRNTFIFCMA